MVAMGATARSETSSDAIVVGGRVAGALTAAYLASAGLEVVVLESGSVSSGTISTHFFRGDGLVRGLSEIGVLDQVLATGPPRLTCDYWYADAGKQPLVEPPQEPGDAGYCLSVRRETLDPMLAAYVARLPGVTWLGRRRVVDRLDADGRLVGVVDSAGAAHAAELVVGADGRRSTVARLVGASQQQQHEAARLLIYCYVTGYASPGPQNGAEFSLRGNEIAYVFPSDHGVTCLGVSVPIARSEEARAGVDSFFDRCLSQHHGLWPRYQASQRLGRVVAGQPTSDYVRRPSGPGWALVGDAGVHQDPWSGEGMDSAARQARALAATFVAGDDRWPPRYADARDAVALQAYEDTVSIAEDLSVLAQQ